ncbi:hypothetical protein BN2476_1240049 [Paraburkholderia piptadeniae]|uniref:Uncharacterized protein n=1 Tax=Paraburkholderia piptadeniae TaxID=1701573 RepID=A0A1N7SVT8_9BURK|nr:hypothetical protein BN2476_1240049 [Paraburkholderia piptadeniae]
MSPAKKDPPPGLDGGPEHAPKVRDNRYDFRNLGRYMTTCRNNNSDTREKQQEGYSRSGCSVNN